MVTAIKDMYAFWGFSSEGLDARIDSFLGGIPLFPGRPVQLPIPWIGAFHGTQEANLLAWVCNPSEKQTVSSLETALSTLGGEVVLLQNAVAGKVIRSGSVQHQITRLLKKPLFEAYLFPKQPLQAGWALCATFEGTLVLGIDRDNDTAMQAFERAGIALTEPEATPYWPSWT